MQVSVQAGEGLKREMRVDLPADDIEAEVDKRLQKFARSARVPGFRPGKVPVRVLRQQYGDQVCSEVLGEMVQSTFPTAVKQEDLKPAGMPSIETDVDQKARRYAYTASFEVFPIVALKSLADAKIKRPVAEIAETDVDQMIERLRQQRCEWIEVERGARKGDQVSMAFEGTVDGEAFDGGAAENYTVEIGTDRMIAGFEDALIGAAPAQAREFDLQFPEDYRATHLAGKQVHFKVQVHKVAEPKLPEVDADFIKSMGVGSGEMADFCTDVRQTMERELRERVDEIVKSRVFDALVEANPTELPQSLIDQEARAMRESLTKSSSNQPLPFPASFFLETARRRVATGVLMNEVVRHHALSVSDDAVRKKLEALAAGYEQPQAVINHYLADKERLSQVRASLLEETVVAHLLAEAQVEDEPKAFFELTETEQ